MIFVRCRLSLVLLLGATLVSCILQNVTVDDAAVTGSIPRYLPDPAWKQGASCSGCGAQPDPQGAFNGTWHDGTFTPSDGIAKAIEFAFNGSAIYVFFILANTIEFVDTVTNMNFILDAQPVGAFIHDPSASTDFEYNVPVYVNETIPLGQHNLRMEAAGNRSALILFDYLIYTSDADDTTSAETPLPSPTESAFDSSGTGSNPSGSNVAPIVGGTVAGVISFLVLAGALLFYWRRRRRSLDPEISNSALFTTQELHRHGILSSHHTNANVNPFILTAIDIPSSTHQRRSMVKVTRRGTVETNPNEDVGSKTVEQTATCTTTLASSSQQGNTTVDVQSSTHTAVLREQVELLMDEVTRLRHLQLQETNAFEVGSEAPPGYSEGRASVDSTQ